jgi:short-subunit dehydrogenase
MSSNYAGALHMIFAVLPGMRARRSGSIVNVTSIGGKVAVPHLLPYDAAKFALVGLSEGLRAELAPAGISVTTVIPGLMRTGSALHATFGGPASKEFSWFVPSATLPLFAMNADRAARRIVDAVRRRAPVVVLSWQAKLLRVIHDLAPGVTARVLGLAARVLPKGEGVARPVEGRVLFELKRPVLVGSLLCKDATHTNEI